MKKKIELQIPENVDIEGREDIIERRILGTARAISKRVKLNIQDEKRIKKDSKGKSYVELDLTQEQIDKLPIGLKKLLKDV